MPRVLKGLIRTQTLLHTLEGVHLSKPSGGDKPIYNKKKKKKNHELTQLFLLNNRINIIK